jgi:G3E family GTPase
MQELARRSVDSIDAVDRIEMWIITGFLGSGKTTLLNHLLQTIDDYPQSRPSGSRAAKVGVLVNDFGDLSIDATLVRPVDGPTSVIELNGGQIFCSCLAGSFVGSLLSLCERGVSTIIVEGSGLAKPRPMADIVAAAVEKTEGRLRFRGAIGVVDAKRFEALRQTVNAVEEQVYFADIVVVNKIDEVEPDDLLGIQRSVAEINPTAPIVQSEFGRISWRMLLSAADQKADEANNMRGPGGAPPTRPSDECEGVPVKRFAGWNAPGRPTARSYKPAGPMSRGEVEYMLSYLSPGTLRIKGYVEGRESDWFVSAIGTYYRITEAPKDRYPAGLTVIAPAHLDLAERFAETRAALSSDNR